MRPLSLSGSEPFRRLLVIGSHADDIEIGCGGALLMLTRTIPELEVDWLVLAAPGERGEEARASAEAFLSAASTSHVEIHGFRDGFLPYIGDEVKDLFEIYKTTNVWPFNPKALTFILVANAIQLALTIKELMGLIPE